MKSKLLINILASLIAFTSSVVINFFVSPYIIRHVGIEAFGFITLANNFIIYIELLTVALNSMGGRFVALEYHRLEKREASEYFSTIFYSNLIMGCVLVAVCTIFILNMQKFIPISDFIQNDIKLSYFIMLLNFVLSIVMSIYGSIYIISNTIYKSSKIQLISNCIKVSTIYIFFSFFAPHVSYYLISIFASNIYMQISNFLKKRELVKDISCSWKYFSAKKLKTVVSSGIWNTVNRVGSVLSVNLDVFLVTTFMGVEITGIYGLVKIIPNFFYSITGTLVSVFFPNLVELYAKNDYAGMTVELEKSMKIFALVFNMPIVAFLAFGDIFFSFWVPEQNVVQLYVLSSILLVSLTIVGPATLIYNLLTILNKLKLSSSLILCTGILGSSGVYLSLKYTDWGLIGVAAIPTLFNLIRNISFVIPYGALCLGKKWYYFHFISMRSLGSVIISVLSGVLYKSYIAINSWEMLIAAVFFVMLISFFVQYRFLLSGNERIAFRAYVGKCRSIF